VVLTGGDGDGADGVKAIKAAWGVTFAQDLPSSQQPSMPRSAAATGDVDFVLTLPEIAAALVALVGRERTLPDKACHEKALVAEKEGSVRGKHGSQASAIRDKSTRQVRVGRERVAGLLARVEETPTAPDLLEAAVEELAACVKVLGVAEGALCVQSDMITSYWLLLEAEAARPPSC